MSVTEWDDQPQEWDGPATIPARRPGHGESPMQDYLGEHSALLQEVQRKRMQRQGEGTHLPAHRCSRVQRGRLAVLKIHSVTLEVQMPVQGQRCSPTCIMCPLWPDVDGDLQLEVLLSKQCRHQGTCLSLQPGSSSSTYMHTYAYGRHQLLACRLWRLCLVPAWQRWQCQPLGRQIQLHVCLCR